MARQVPCRHHARTLGDGIVKVTRLLITTSFFASVGSARSNALLWPVAQSAPGSVCSGRIDASLFCASAISSHRSSSTHVGIGEGWACMDTGVGIVDSRCCLPSRGSGFNERSARTCLNPSCVSCGITGAGHRHWWKDGRLRGASRELEREDRFDGGHTVASRVEPDIPGERRRRRRRVRPSRVETRELWRL